jgi:DNA-binding YbaB/EbfC family protein
MANIFSQAKELYKMQAEARAMQKKMQEIVVSGLSKNEQVEVRVNGANELQQVNIDDELIDQSKKALLEKSIKQAFQDANKKLQKELMKGMDINKMKSMLGV